MNPINIKECKLLDLTIEIIQRCPNRCIFCSSLSGMDSKHLISRREVLNIIKQAKKLGLRRVAISGGEPLYHPEIVGIANDILSQNLHMVVYTNGISPSGNGGKTAFLDWDVFDEANTTLIFNVQSTKEDIHDRLTNREGSLRLTRSSIYAAKKAGFRVEVHLVPNRLNLNSIESSVIDLEQWGVDQINFLRLVPQGYASENIDDLLFCSNELEILREKFFLLSKQKRRSIHLRFGIPFSGILSQPTPCNAGKTKLIIRYDGKVLPCEAFKSSELLEFVLGDIWQNTLDQILNQRVPLKSLNALKCRVNCEETCPAQLLYSEIVSSTEISQKKFCTSLVKSA